MKKAMIGYQVYSARRAILRVLFGTLKALKEMGYDGVEFAGFYGHSAQEVRGMLDDLGLIASPTTCPSRRSRRICLAKSRTI